ncbi:MFS transporter [Thermosediminibacter litoriperuensis]|uniref:MFS transporter n=1 Tax=Thermosediminibacter litoriperuensis TaxID=291989 RepID=UPI0014789583|nr:MFS transporter [Thermosediminibacter litoriperuensis]
MFKKYASLPGSIYIIAFANLINSMGTFVRPFLTLFLTDRMGLSPDYAGLLVSISSMVRIPGSILGGRLCDSIGRKKVMIIFGALSALSLVVCAFSANTSLLINLLIFSSFALSVSAPAETSVIVDLTNTGNRKEAFSLSYLFHNLGFAVGPILASFLYKNYLKLLFIGDALATFIALGLIALGVPETKPERGKIDDAALSEYERFEEGSTLAVLLKRPVLLVYALISVLYTLVYSQSTFSLPIYLKELFGDAGPKLYGSVMSANAVTVVVCTTLVTNLTSNLRSLINIAGAGMLYALGFGMIMFAKNPWILLLSTFIWTLGEILCAVNERAFIAEYTPASHRGRINAVIPLIMGAGFSISPWLTGMFLKYHGVRWVWPLSFFIAAFGATGMFALNLVDKRRVSPAQKTSANL